MNNWNNKQVVVDSVGSVMFVDSVGKKYGVCTALIPDDSTAHSWGSLVQETSRDAQ